MIIYVDVLVTLNAYITYFTLKTTAAILHLGYKIPRIIAASVLGGLSALTAVLPLNFFCSFVLRFALTAAVTAAAFGYNGIKPLILRSAISIAAASLVCGTAVLLREITGSSFFGAAGGYAYLDISALTLVFSTTAVYTVISLFRRLPDKGGDYVKIKVTNNGKTAELSALKDSGNNLKDFLSGRPVIVCRKEAVDGLFDFDIEKDMQSGLRIIPFSSVGGGGYIKAFRPQSVCAVAENGREKLLDVLIGVKNEALENEDFDAILNPKIL